MSCKSSNRRRELSSKIIYLSIFQTVPNGVLIFTILKIDTKFFLKLGYATTRRLS